MNAIKNDVQANSFLDPEKKARQTPALEGMFISKYVQKEIRFAHHYAQTNIWRWNIGKARLLNKIVIELNRDSPDFKFWLEANGFLLNTHTPGKKLTSIKGVFRDKRSNYYCYHTTHLFLILLSSLYRHGDLDHFRE
jgi:hypothetical protein